MRRQCKQNNKLAKYRKRHPLSCHSESAQSAGEEPALLNQMNLKSSGCEIADPIF
jgi:hypothetical protein